MIFFDSSYSLTIDPSNLASEKDAKSRSLFVQWRLKIAVINVSEDISVMRGQISLFKNILLN